MNIGIFGVGDFGEKHINVLKNIKNFNIIGFYDPDLERSKEIEKRFQINYTDNPIELIDKCDAIDIVSETATHYKLIQLAISKKKHIFIEKPICSKKSEILELLKKIEKYSSIIQIGHIERYNPAFRQGFKNLNNIKSIVAKRTGSLNSRNKNTSIALDLMIHDIDLIISSVKSEIIKIKATGQEPLNDLYNYIDCEIHFENGVTANLIAARGENMENERKMTINYVNKVVEIDLLNRINTIKTKDNQKFWKCEKDINLLEKEFIDFWTSVTENKEPIVNAKAACRAVTIALEIEKLINTN